MERFAAHDAQKTGLLSLPSFLSALEASAPADRAWATQLFEMFDQDQDGALSYSEFVAGLLCLPLLCSALAWAPVLAWQPSSLAGLRIIAH
jgi:hypothetical protein